MHVYVVCVHLCVHRMPEKGIRYSVPFLLVLLRQGLLLNVELLFFGQVGSQQAPGILLPSLSAVLE